MMSVLYVDDEEVLLDITKMYIERTGEISVDTTTSALLALKKIGQAKYDVIVSDYQMPDMDGIAFLKKLRSDDNGIPFIIFTGRGREEVVIEALNNGADFYLQKGGEPKSQFAELQSKIQQAARRNQAEHSLQESEQRLADIINFLPDATFAIDRSGHVIAWNHAIEDMTGIPAGDMLGKGDYEYAIPFYGKRRRILIDLIGEPDEKIAEFYSDISRTGNSVTAETVVSHQKGYQISVLSKAGPLCDLAGEVIGAIESIRDITARKRDITALQQVTTELQLIFKNMSNAFIVWESVFDQNGTYVSFRFGYFNDAYARISKLEYEKVRGKDVFDVWPTTERSWVEVYGSVATTGIPRVFDMYHEPTQGWYHCNAYRPSESTARVCAIFEDITERRRAETELRAAYEQITAAEVELRQKYDELSGKETELKESGKRYRSMIENIQAAVVLHNPDTSIQMINNLALELLGITKDEAIGRSASDPTWHLSREDGSILPLADYPVNRVLATRKPLRKMLLGIFRPGRGDTVWVLVDADPEFDENGALTAILITFTDITDRRQAEEEQHERERFLTTLISNLPGFAYRCNNDPAWTMEYMSEGCRKITGYAPEDFLGNKILAYNDIIHPDFRKHLWDMWQDQLKKKETFEDEYPIITKTGETRWVWERGRGIFNAHGDLVHLEGYITDISTRKYAEEAFRQANRKLNLLSGITRHDIMNQLLALEGYLGLSKKTLDNPARTSEFIEKIEKVARNISHQIKFTRDYEDLGVKAPVWQNVNATMGKSISRLPMQNIRIEKNDPTLEVLADPLLEKVFYNLIDNALQYGGGKMTVIRMTHGRDNGNLVIRVEDDGNGISDEDKKQLFTRGFGQHTGLGLYLSREILSITGITITENGEPGKGARFEMMVPDGAYRFNAETT